MPTANLGRVTGKSIKGIIKTGTAGLVDTYETVLDDDERASQRTFTVTNGTGIFVNSAKQSEVQFSSDPQGQLDKRKILTFTSLAEIGLSDNDDMNEADFGANVAVIAAKLTSLGRAAILRTTISSPHTSHLAESLGAEIITTSRTFVLQLTTAPSALSTGSGSVQYSANVEVWKDNTNEYFRGAYDSNATPAWQGFLLEATRNKTDMSNYSSPAGYMRLAIAEITKAWGESLCTFILSDAENSAFSWLVRWNVSRGSGTSVQTNIVGVSELRGAAFEPSRLKSYVTRQDADRVVFELWLERMSATPGTRFNVHNITTLEQNLGAVDGSSFSWEIKRSFVQEQTPTHISVSEGKYVTARNSSPEFTGSPKAPTPPASDNSARLATTEYTQNLLNSQKTNVPSKDSQKLLTAGGAHNINVYGKLYKEGAGLTIDESGLYYVRATWGVIHISVRDSLGTEPSLPLPSFRDIFVIVGDSGSVIYSGHGWDLHNVHGEGGWDSAHLVEIVNNSKIFKLF